MAILPMKICVLASGSKGNSTLLKCGENKILIDIGVSTRYIEKELKDLNIDPKTIKYIFLTHIHNDHIFGLKTFLKKYKPILFLSESMYYYLIKIMPINDYQIIEKFIEIDNIHINAIKLSHDSEEVNGYIFKYNNKELVYITDTGYINVRYHHELSNKDFYVIESNHDISMLMKGKYPNHLKRRIISDKGHLSNDDSIKYLNKFINTNTKGIMFIHMSESNNSEELILEAINRNLSNNPFKPSKIVISKQNEKTEMIEID
jgi:phosphoribosyl 1,2-cyclic phosphodiesterase